MVWLLHKVVSISYGDKEKFELRLDDVYELDSLSICVSISYGDKEKFEHCHTPPPYIYKKRFQSPMEIKRNLNKRA